ncbi:hypothetical protein AUEXF2481DRAFT_184735 [Aureobasidium subglaciale EXF-2481]|uniref:Uncharacterized protein n=1 Tax=Aureobasidium subglaciale (strain EXF-2481) TaxID=1043005 RepID=A0A074ZMJ6_AURSE|nr:uncharacterized protein AUEXF2481DRAFT_184735 [Aureobasidium subglaciale EXF-2481]KAI5194621.1 hypothetical protein E4T38_09492 [Aureobasidium subglaciale]KAI5213784.1 hypothetical protein E4T40_09455 [Aureobasidium subglaciale]KAI5215815.1 hypothetical protein E4T41_09444 [Aureobasidium subglaciale]KAI5253884.1 hypothetical protein E4T46_09399 [Aureobasidium subglaciale]KEQ99576.1 hypothetical protein AUEXF2481DRAFT_184735 [Aureobasidium subglaciale EXF-2481]
MVTLILTYPFWIAMCLVPLVPPCWMPVNPVVMGEETSLSEKQRVVKLLMAMPASEKTEVTLADGGVVKQDAEPAIATVTYTVPLRATTGSNITREDEVNAFFAELLAPDRTTMISVPKMTPTPQEVP